MSLRRCAVRWRLSKSGKSLKTRHWFKLHPKGLSENFGLILVRADDIGKHRSRNQKVFFAHDQGGSVEAGEFEAVAMRDGVSGTGFDTVAAEDASVVVDVVDLGVALGGGDAYFFSVLRSFDVNAVRRACGGAEEAGDTLLKAVLVALQLVLAAETLLKLRSAHGTFAVRIVLDFGRLEDLLQRDAHSLGNGCGVADDRHALSIRRGRYRLEAMKRASLTIPVLVSLCFAGVSAAEAHGQTVPTEVMAEHQHAPTPPSTSLVLTVDGKATTLSVADLAAMSQKTVTVHNEHTKTDETYTGVLLGDLLAKYGFPVDKTTHRKMLRSYLVAEGIDKYWVLYSVTEIEGSEHNGNVIVATSMGGKPLGEDGQLKLVDSEDKKPQRWVRNLSAITVKSAE
jgi:hypothetical protein